MTVKYIQQPHDYYRFNLYHQWEGPHRKLYRIKTFVIPPLLILLYVMFEFFMGEEIVNTALMLGFGAFVYVLLIKGIVTSQIGRATNLMFNSGENVDAFSERTIEFLPENIKVASPNAKSEIKWEMVEKLAENYEYFFVYLSSTTAFIIPKDQLQDENELREVIQLQLAQRS